MVSNSDDPKDGEAGDPEVETELETNMQVHPAPSFLWFVIPLLLLGLLVFLSR